MDLTTFTLFANRLADDLAPLLERLSGDKHSWPMLLRGGFIQFGNGADIDYDPVCFDPCSRRQNADSGIVKLDHEEILWHERLNVAEKVRNIFRDLAIQTINLAERDSPQA